MKFNAAPSGNILLVWDRIGDYHAARFQALEDLAGQGSVFISDLGAADQLYQWKNPLHQHPAYLPLSSKPVEKEDYKNRLRNFKKLIESQNIQTVGIAGYGRAEYRFMLPEFRFSSGLIFANLTNTPAISSTLLAEN